MLRGVQARILITSRRYYHRYSFAWRLMHAGLALIVVVSLLIPLYNARQQQTAYALSPTALKLVGQTDSLLTSKLTFNSKKQQYVFNQAGLTPTANPKDPTHALMAAKTGTGGNGSNPLYALTVPTDLHKGVTYQDTNTGLNFSIVPSFTSLPGRQEQGHLVYPLSGNTQAVYTLKGNGLKEDIVVPKATSDQLAFTYRLELPDTLAAKTIPGTNNIGIYSADPSLFGNISYSSPSDKASVMRARVVSPKTNLVFGLPAPVITSANGGSNHASTHFILKNNTLLVVASGLSSIKGAFSIDPSVVVNSTASFATGNNEDNIAFGTNQISRGGLTGGTMNGGWTATGALAQAVANASTVEYNGYVYQLGGFNSANLQSVEYAALSSSGGVAAPASCGTGYTLTGSWCYNANGLPYIDDESTAVAYNGNIYLMGGCSSTCPGGGLSTVSYAAINTTNGALTEQSCPTGWTLYSGNWCYNSTSLPQATFFATSVVYNNYVYVIGGDVTTGGTVSQTVDYAPLSAAGGLGSQTTCATGWTLYGGTWCYNATSLPVALNDSTSVVYNGYVYEIGGYNGTAATANVYYAPLNSNGSVGSWTTTTVLPVNMQQSTATAYNGYLYEIGGNPSGIVSTVYYAPIYGSGAIGPWLTTSGLPAALDESTSVTYDGYIYQIGGYNGSADVATVNYARIDPAGSLVPWTTTNGLIKEGTGKGYQGRENNAVVAYGGYLYSLGGDNSGAQYYNESTTINSDGSLGAWTTATSLPASYTGVTAAAYSGYMFFFNGCSAISSGTCGTHTTAQSYSAPITASSGALGSWTAQATPPTALWGQAIVQYGSYVYLLGGIDSSGAYNTYVYYAQLTTTGGIAANSGCGTAWCTATGFTTGRAFAGATIAGGYLYLAGGVHATSDTACNPTASTTCSDVQYAALTSSGALSANTCGTSTTWCTAPNVPAGITNGIYAYRGCLYTPNGYFAPIQSSGNLGSWQSTTTYATARTNFGSAQYNNTLYIVGGDSAGTYDSDAQYSYPSNGGTGTAGSWTTLSNSLQTTTYASMSATYNNYVYEVGGNTGSITQQVEYAKLAGTGLASLGSCPAGWTLSSSSSWCYNATSLPVGNELGSVAAYNGYLYLAGGYLSTGAATATTYYAPIKSDGSIGAWTAMANLQQVTDQETAVAYNGYLYVMGGNNGTETSEVEYAKLGAGGSLAALSSCPTGWTLSGGSWCYNATALNTAVQTATSVVLNGYLYVLGGYTSANVPISTVQYAAINSNGSPGSWNVTTSLPGVDSSGSAVTYNGFIYSIGGWNANNIPNVNMATTNADGAIDSWTPVTNLNIANDYLTAVAGQGNIYAIGGSNGTTGVADVEYAPVSSIPRKAHYSKLIDLGYNGATPESLTYSGLSAAGSTVITYRTAASNGVLGSTQNSTSLNLPSANCVTGAPGSTRYVWVEATLDDSAVAGFPDIYSPDANITSITLNYAYGWHPAPAARLRLGQSFYNTLLQPFDTCTP